jgi:hypothetical protein
VPPLSDSNPTNWLLDKNPDAYLFGCLVEAELYIGHDERVPLWAQRREAALASIEQADRKARWGSPMSIVVDGITAPAGGGGSGGASSAMAGVSVGDAPPTNPRGGDLWWDSVGGNLYFYYIDPSGPPGQWTAATNQPGPGTDNILTVYPGTGATVTLTGAATSVYVATGPLAELTIKLPDAPVVRDTVQLAFAYPVTALAVQDAAGAAVPSAPTSAYGPGAAVIFRYVDPGMWAYWK